MMENMTDKIVKKLQDLRQLIDPCHPPFWARSGHGQTIVGHLLPSPKLKERGEHFHITLNKESEKIHTTYLRGSSDVVVYLFHGLGGSSDAGYMQRSAQVARSLGHHVFMNNHRGCGSGLGLASEPYHSGRAEDLSKVIEFGKRKLPHLKHIAIGFSLSANALLLLAAKERADVLPDIAIAINGPINLDRASVMLNEGLNQLYDKRFVLDLKRYMNSNRPGSYLKSVKGMREFDEVYTAPIGGFQSRAHYYETCSAKDHLFKIAIPTVLLSAEDDPFVSGMDYKEAILSETTVLHLEKHGGHMGYLTHKGLGFERWLDGALRHYLQVYNPLHSSP